MSERLSSDDKALVAFKCAACGMPEQFIEVRALRMGERAMDWMRHCVGEAARRHHTILAPRCAPAQLELRVPTDKEEIEFYRKRLGVK